MTEKTVFRKSQLYCQGYFAEADEMIRDHRGHYEQYLELQGQTTNDTEIRSENVGQCDQREVIENIKYIIKKWAMR